MFGYLDLHLGLPCGNTPVAVLTWAVLSRSLAVWMVPTPGPCGQWVAPGRSPNTQGGKNQGGADWKKEILFLSCVPFENKCLSQNNSVTCSTS